MRKEKVFTIFVVTLFVLGITHVYGEDVRGVSKDTIKVGLIADMTGPVTAVTVPMSNGIKNYLRYLNEQGGIHGRKIRLIHEDDRYSVPLTLAAFKKLVFRDGILTCIMVTGTANISALMPHYEKQKLPIISVSSAEIIVKPVKRYVFTVQDTYQNRVKTVIDYILKDLKAKNPVLACANLDNESGRTISRAIQETVKPLGIKFHEEYISPAAIDATSQVMNSRRAKANYVILGGSDGTAICFLRDAYKIGYKPQFIGTLFSNSEAIIEIAGRAADGYICDNPFALWGDAAKGVQEMMRITEGYLPGKRQTVDYTVGWVKSMILAEGIKRGGEGLNSESLVEGIETIRGFDTEGLTGPLTYGSDDHKGGNYTRFLKAYLKNKTFIPITEWRRSSD
ncbi:MAG: ABC transporter substrate-binding protein [Thermodesulfobacteriota bacterium]